MYNPSASSVKIIEGTTNSVTVVFLHGYLLSSKIWLNLALSQASWRSVFIDLPYHGTHRHIALTEQNLDFYADFVKQSLKDVGFERYILVGHSMGGYIGLRMLERDNSIEKLILLHSNIWEDSEERKKNRERVVRVVKRSKKMFLSEAVPILFKDKYRHKETIQSIIEEAMTMSATGIVHGAMSMRNRKASHKIVKRFIEKCYFIQGSHDALVDVHEARKTWLQVGDPSKFRLIEDCAHMSMYEQPLVLEKTLYQIVETTRQSR
jgi:pimeloyl-ACP methyl ester carboxylesterase